MIRYATGLISALVLVGCTRLSNVQCDQSSNCDLAGGGTCLASSGGGGQWCAYPDPDCASGYRFSSQGVGDGVSGMCTEAPAEIDGGINADHWVTRRGGAADDYGTGIAFESNGDVVITGYSAGTLNLGGSPLVPSGAVGAWVARYKSDGTHVWSISLGTHSAISSVVSSEHIAIDEQGDVYLAGSFSGETDFGGGLRTSSNGRFIVKLSGANGSYLWDKVIESSTIDLTSVIAIGSRIAVCGMYGPTIELGGGVRTTLGVRDNFLAVYEANGAHVWSKTLGGPNNDAGVCTLAATGKDLVAVSGFQHTIMLGGAPLTAHGNEDIFVARFRGADGMLTWSINEGALASRVYPRSIVSDDARIYVGGFFANTTNLGGGNLVPTATTTGDPTDAFLAAYSLTDGRHQWSQRFGGPDENQLSSISTSASKLVAAISFDGSIGFGANSLTSVGREPDFAIVRIDAATGAAEPALTLFGSESPVSLTVGYVRGKLYGVGTFSGSAAVVGTSLLSAGKKDVATFNIDF